MGKLGRRNLHFRLGGIYALGLISQDSAELHWPVMEVLTAFLREGSKAPIDTTSGGAEIIYKPPGPGHSTPRPIAADLEAAARVIAWRPEERRQEEFKNDRRLDLYRARLAGANLYGAHLQRAFLAGADLKGALLAGAHLEEATLGDALLEEAILADARLEGADLYGAHLAEADLHGAHLEGALLAGAHLEGADLRGAHLEGARLDSEKSPFVDMPDASGLTREQLEQALWDEKTRLPSYLAKPVSEPGS